MTLALTVLGALLLTAVWSLVSRHWLPAIMVIVVAVIWVLTNSPVEGPVLWTVAAGHGLTVADLLAPLCALIGLVRLTLLLRHRRVVTVDTTPTRTPVESGSGTGSPPHRD